MSRTVVGLCLALTLGAESVRAAYHIFSPRIRESVRGLVEVLEERADPDDLVFVYYGAAPTFRFYTSDRVAQTSASGGRFPHRVAYGKFARRTPELYEGQLDALAGEPRVWILLSHVCDWEGHDEGRIILEHLDRCYLRLESHERPGSLLLLYDTRTNEQRMSQEELHGYWSSGPNRSMTVIPRLGYRSIDWRSAIPASRSTVPETRSAGRSRPSSIMAIIPG